MQKRCAALPVYKSGTGTRGHWMRVWGLGTWGGETKDLQGTAIMGRGDVWDGDAGTCGTGTRDVKYKDVGTSNTGTRGMCTIIAKVRVKCDISFFVRMCYLLSTLDSIVQNHIRQLMMFTQNISLYRSKRTDYRD